MDPAQLNLPDTSRPCVVIHEHSDALRAVLEQTLQDAGIVGTQGLRTAADVVPALATGGVDLLLLDLDAPDTDVFGLCRDIRRRYPRLGLLAMSTRSGADLLARCLDAGADHLLSKPLSAGELTAHVRRVLERARAWDVQTAASGKRVQF